MDADQPAAVGGALSAPSGEPVVVTAGSLAMEVVAPSRPAETTDGARHLLYEVLIQNIGATTALVTGIDVIGDPDARRPGGGAPLASYRGDALASVLVVGSGEPATAGVPPGGLAVGFFDIALAANGRLPREMGTTLTVDEGGGPTTVDGPRVAVVSAGPHRPLGPPLRGDRLLDLNGCCDGPHRRALLADGGLFLAQRYAIDFVRVDDQGTFSGDPTRNESYFLFGAEAVATAPGRIVGVVDGMPENVPTAPLPPATLETAPGNHVVEALDDGRFALYAHLQTGSVRVRPGARVERGEVLGLVGNTGNSTEPHLHFHVMDGPVPLLSDGLPFVFDCFALEARVDLSGPVPVVTVVPPPQQRRRLLPMNGDIIAFP